MSNYKITPHYQYIIDIPISQGKLKPLDGGKNFNFLTLKSTTSPTSIFSYLPPVLLEEDSLFPSVMD